MQANAVLERLEMENDAPGSLTTHSDEAGRPLIRPDLPPPAPSAELLEAIDWFRKQPGKLFGTTVGRLVEVTFLLERMRAAQAGPSVLERHDQVLRLIQPGPPSTETEADSFAEFAFDVAEHHRQAVPDIEPAPAGPVVMTFSEKAAAAAAAEREVGDVDIVKVWREQRVGIPDGDLPPEIDAAVQEWIVIATRAIRAGWSDKMHHERAGLRFDKRWHPPCHRHQGSRALQGVAD